MKSLLLVGMAVFLKNTAFHGILLDALFESTCEDKKEVVRLLNEGIKSGAVRPLPSTVFSETQVEQAFRYRFVMISTVCMLNSFIILLQSSCMKIIFFFIKIFRSLGLICY
jgi:hypothetical protein